MPELKNSKSLREIFTSTLKNVKDPFGGGEEDSQSFEEMIGI